jgi:hypothetical protein
VPQISPQTECLSAECHYAEYRNAEYRNAEYRNAEYRIAEYRYVVSWHPLHITSICQIEIQNVCNAYSKILRSG